MLCLCQIRCPKLLQASWPQGLPHILLPFLQLLQMNDARIDIHKHWFTQKVIWPGFKCFNPSSFGMILQLGGRMLDTETRLHFSTPAPLNASSNEVSLSLCTPNPFVKNNFCGIIIVNLSYLYQPGSTIDISTTGYLFVIVLFCINKIRRKSAYSQIRNQLFSTQERISIIINYLQYDGKSR